MSLKIADLPIAVQQDAIEFLEAVVSDLKNGIIPSVARGVMILNFDNEKFAVWNFGPKNGGPFTSLAMCALGQQLFNDLILGG